MGGQAGSWLKRDADEEGKREERIDREEESRNSDAGERRDATRLRAQPMTRTGKTHVSEVVQTADTHNRAPTHEAGDLVATTRATAGVGQTKGAEMNNNCVTACRLCEWCGGVERSSVERVVVCMW